MVLNKYHKIKICVNIAQNPILLIAGSDCIFYADNQMACPAGTPAETISKGGKK